MSPGSDAAAVTRLDPWNDAQRLPGLSPAARQRLKHLLDQPSAPRFRNRSGHHLQPDDLKALNDYVERETATGISPVATRNAWLPAFLRRSFATVPFYRDYAIGETLRCGMPALQDIPTISRADLSRDITRFVPDDLPLEAVIAYETSGTTGHPLQIPSHPRVAARYSGFHKKALRWNGVDPDTFTSDLAVVLAGFQEHCFTYASICPYLNHKGLVKLNFHPRDWRHPDDRQAYLDANRPDLISGDPVSLAALAAIPFRHQPRAVLSTSMTLLEGTAKQLQQRFGCPVIDLYSLNEVGPVGCSVAGKPGFRLLQSCLLVEILDADGLPVACGERGEVTVTGGFNDYLPLVRYRTGDFARLLADAEADGGACDEAGHWLLVDLEGRPPVRFRTRAGAWLNNVDITHALQPFALSCFALHQQADGGLRLQLAALGPAREVQARLERLLGYPVSVSTLPASSQGQKHIQYTSALAAATP